MGADQKATRAGYYGLLRGKPGVSRGLTLNCSHRVIIERPIG